MTTRNIFISLLGAQTIIIVIWYLAFYNPQNTEMREVEESVNLTSAKLKSAKKAQLDLSSVQDRLINEQLELEKVKKKFLKKDELEQATAQTDVLAKKYSLKLIEFSPVLESYLATANKNQKVKGYPLVITVEGRYMNIGKFIEDWKELPFYMSPYELKIIRVEERSNELQAMISGTLYAFNK